MLRSRKQLKQDVRDLIAQTVHTHLLTFFLRRSKERWASNATEVNSHDQWYYVACARKVQTTLSVYSNIKQEHTMSQLCDIQDKHVATVSVHTDQSISLFSSHSSESIKVGRLTQSQTPCDLHPSLQWTFFTWLCGRSWAVNVKVRASVSEHENLVACGCVYACFQWTKSHVCMLNQSVTRIPLWWFTRSWRFEQRKRETRECVHRRGLTVGALLWI